jgi:hypothetical protein
MKRKSTQKTGDFSLAHVLYQKLGNDWYAFTEVDGDCFMTKVDADSAATAQGAEASRNEQNKHAGRNKRRAA